MKKLLLACMLALGIGASAQITVGSGNTTNSTGPWSSCWGYSYHQQIYTQPSINAAGTITSITLTSAGTLPTTATGATPNDPQGANTNFKIYLGHTTKAIFASTTDWEPAANLTLVYDGALTMPTTSGQQLTINLTTPFAYNNTDNLVIAFDENSPGYACSYTWVANTAQTNMTIYQRSDTVNADPAAPPTGTRSNTTPQVILGGLVATNPPSCVTISAPANAATGVSVTPAITWPAAGGATSYDLAIGTTAGGTDVMPLTDVGNVTSYTLPGANALAYNTVYYVTVYPKNALGTASGCTSNSFTTANIPCPTVTAPVAAAAGQSLTPTFTWNAVTGATGYKITIGTTSGGSDILNAQDVSNVTTWNYAGPALSNSATYYYTINSYDATNASTSCTVRNFTTICGVLAAPYIQNFNSGSLASCWSTFSTNNTGYALWRFSGTADYGTTNLGQVGGTYAWVDASTPYAAIHDVTLQSPQIDLTGLVSPMVQFKWFKNHSTTATGTTQPAYDNNLLTVMVRDVATSTWDTIFNDDSNLLGWRTEYITLPATYVNKVIEVRFIVDKDVAGNPYFYDNIILDDVEVKETPACLEPSGITSSNIMLTSADLSWTAPATAPANGYDVYYSTTNTAPTATTTPNTSVGAGVTTANLAGLTANTTYYVWVRSNCGTSQSAWVGSTVFTGYCQPSVSGTSYWITNFTSTGATTDISYTGTSTATGGYRDLTATHKISNYEGSVTPITLAMGPSSNAGFAVWIDWNNDLLFDVSEKMYATTSYVTTTVGATITVPTGTALGNYRMRVVMDYNNSAPTNPCGAIASGEYIDAIFEVVVPPACAAPTALATSNITTASADLSWTAPTAAPANGYDVYYSTTNTAPTSTTTPTTTSGTTSVSLTPLAQNTMYYVWVRSNCSSTDQSSWVALPSFTTLATPPANDDCSTPNSLTPGGAFAQNAITGSNAGATNTTDATATHTCQATASKEVWYSVVVPASGTITIETKAVTGSTVTDTVLTAYTGSCGALTQVGCDDDAGDVNFSLLTLGSANGVNAGDTVLISVWNYSSTTSGDFQVSAYDGSLAANEVVNIKNDVKIYPNPFTDVVNISNVRNVKSISIVDMAGRVVKTIAKPTAQISLGELKSGMYLINIQNIDGTTNVVKAIKK